MTEDMTEDLITITNTQKELIKIQQQIIEMQDRLSEIETITNQKTTFFNYTNDEYGISAKELHSQIGTPQYCHIGDAGCDIPIILSQEELKYQYKTIWPGEREILHTGIRIELPEGHYARLIHRSSTEKRYRLRVIEGIIDCGYRGELLIQIHNPNQCKIEVRHGHKYAQLIILKLVPAPLQYKEQLSNSDRGLNGFGSTGQ